MGKVSRETRAVWGALYRVSDRLEAVEGALDVFFNELQSRRELLRDQAAARRAAKAVDVDDPVAQEPVLEGGANG